MGLVNVRYINRQDFPTVFVGETTQGLNIDFSDKKVHVPKDALEAYTKALSSDLKWHERAIAFLGATNKAGRKAKVVKDAILLFFPWGRQVSNVTEFITEQIIRPMAKTQAQKETKPLEGKKTLITFGLLFVVGVLGQFGVDLGLELSPDAEWVAIAAGIIGSVLRLVTKAPILNK